MNPHRFPASRRLSPPLRACALCACAVYAVTLAACDTNGAAGPVAGVWEGTARFEIDTLLAEHNARVEAAYEMVFRFELDEDEGLVTGTVTATPSGYRSVREAGHPATTVNFDGSPPLVNDVFGTYLDPVLEVDVPNGPYEEDLWTFDVGGSRAATDWVLVSVNEIGLADSTTFELALRTAETFEMRRVERDAPDGAARPSPERASPARTEPSGLRLPTPARRQRSER